MSHDGGEIYRRDLDVRVNAVEEIEAELARTGVISKEFKSWIMGWTYEVARQAYERGRVEGVRVAGGQGPLPGVGTRPLPHPFQGNLNAHKCLACGGTRRQHADR